MTQDLERRIDLSGDLGYIKGSLDALHPKIDSMQKEIKSNSGRIVKVENQLSKYKHVLLGIGGVLSAAWTLMTILGTDVQKFIHHLFSGGGNS